MTSEELAATEFVERMAVTAIGSGLPADRGGAALRRHAVAEEEPPHRYHRALIGATIVPAPGLVRSV